MDEYMIIGAGRDVGSWEGGGALDIVYMKIFYTTPSFRKMPPCPPASVAYNDGRIKAALIA